MAPEQPLYLRSGLAAPGLRLRMDHEGNCQLGPHIARQFSNKNQMVMRHENGDISVFCGRRLLEAQLVGG